MATLEQIAEGIRRAHAAGDADSVRRLGEAYRAMQAQQAAPQGAFSDLRDAGMIRQDPGQEDLWMPDAPASSGGDAWRRGILAPIEKNTETGAFRPAVPQIALDAWGALTLPGDALAGNVPDLDPRVGMGNMSDETMERAFNLSGMATIGAPVGAPGIMSANTGRPLPSSVGRALERGGIRPEDVGGRVSALGPGAVAADIAPSMQTLAMGAAARPSAGQSQFFELLKGRATGARDRIQTQVNDILGPSVSRGQQTAHVADLKSSTSPLYVDSFSQSAPVDVSGIAATIDGMLPNLAGTVRSRLRSVRSMIAPDGKLTDNPELLFSVRNEIDDMIDSPNVGRAVSQLQQIRDMVDGELAAKVPGIKDADAMWQELSRQSKEFDAGRALFGQGREAMDPRDTIERLITGVEPQGTLIGPSGGAFALSQGARNEIDRLIGTGTANRTKLAQAIRGDGTWNRENLALAFGDEKADAIIRIFDSEATMFNTENMVMGNSITGLRQAAADDLRPPAQNSPIFQGPTGIDLGNLLRRGAGKITGGISERVAESRNNAVLEALMETGGWYENRTSPATLGLIRALLTGGEPREEASPASAIRDLLMGL